MERSTTAYGYTLMTIKSPAYYAPAPDPDFVERYMRMFRIAMPLRSDRQELINGPSPVEPQWLSVTERRIRESVFPEDHIEPNDGRWLSHAVAYSATAFFQATSHLLPSEPYIYSSRLGDLVAEFKAEHGTMTCVVSPKFALLFAVINGEPVERKVMQGNDAREDVRQLTAMLRSGHMDGVATR